jgi:hypothetical protein
LYPRNQNQKHQRIITDGRTFKKVDATNPLLLLQTAALSGYIYQQDQVISSLLIVTKYDKSIREFSNRAEAAYSNAEYKKLYLYIYSLPNLIFQLLFLTQFFFLKITRY